MTIHKSGFAVHAALSGELTIADAASLYGQLFAEIDAEVSLVIAADGVTRMDASIAQLFLFASRCVRNFHVATRSAAWDNALASLGLSFLPTGTG